MLLELRGETPTALAWVHTDIRSRPSPRGKSRALPGAASSRTASAGWHQWFPGLSGGPSTEDLRKQGERSLQVHVLRQASSEPPHTAHFQVTRPETTRRAQGASVLSRWRSGGAPTWAPACRGNWLISGTGPVSPSQPLGAGGLPPAQPPLVLSPAPVRRLSVRLSTDTVRGGPAAAHSPPPPRPHRNRAGGTRGQGHPPGNTAHTARLGVCHVSQGRF